MEPGKFPLTPKEAEESILSFTRAELTWAQICCQSWETAYYAAQAQIVQLHAKVAYLELVIADPTEPRPGAPRP